MEPEDCDCDGLDWCERCDGDYAEAQAEQAMDEMLAQRELEDFEQADEYFGGTAEEHPW
jgi:hypothetical protein